VVATVAEHTFAGMRCSAVADLAPAFVLGILDPSEADAVRRHLAECPELHAEMAELNSVVPALFEAVEPVAPPAGLKDRILAAAAADLEGRRSAVAPMPATGPAATASPVATRAPAATEAAPATRVARPTPVTGAPSRGWDLGGLFRRPVWAAVAATALAVAIAMGAWNVQLRNDLAGLEAYRAEVVNVLDAAAKPGAQLAVLVGKPGEPGPSGLAAVGADGSVALVMRNLTPTSGSQVYEAWLIAADGVPVPIGDFKVGADGSGTLTTAHEAMGEGVTVALTLEPGPGATAPTPPIVVAGVARGESS
jgi:anti-sigma-K factor RskA